MGSHGSLTPRSGGFDAITCTRDAMLDAAATPAISQPPPIARSTAATSVSARDFEPAVPWPA